MNRRIGAVTAIISLLTLVLVGCPGVAPVGDGGGTRPDESISVPPISTTPNAPGINAQFPARASAADQSLVAATTPNSDGTSTNALVAVFVSDGSLTPEGRSVPTDAVLLGYTDGNDEVTVSAHTTAVALVLLNPLLFGLEAEQRESFIAAVENHRDFDYLVNLISTRLSVSPSETLREDVIQEAVAICLDVLQYDGPSGSSAKQVFPDKDIHDPDESLFRDLPFVKDAPGNQVIFVNPRLAHFAGYLYRTGEVEPIQTVYMDARGGLLVDFSFTWTWPPRITVLASNPETNLGIFADGAYTARFSKTWSFDRIADPTQWPPQTRATVENVAKLTVTAVSLITDVGEQFDLSKKILDFPLIKYPAELIQLEEAARNGDLNHFMTEFYKLTSKRREEIAYWIWQEFATESTHALISLGADILEKATVVLEIFEYANDKIPFVSDLILPLGDIEISFQQVGGELQDADSQPPPPPQQYTLMLTPSPSNGGAITANPLPTNGTYAGGAVVQLTANPASGYQFSSWSGDASGTTNPTTVTMNPNRSVTAIFTVVPPPCNCPDEGNPCTNDVCVGGQCTHPNNSNSCNDGLYCNGADTCNAGSCSAHAGNPCAAGATCNEGTDSCDTTCSCADDGNPCTNDVCVGGQCTHPNNSNSCNDGLYCNGADTCNAGSCSAHPGNPCAGGTTCNEGTDSCDTPQCPGAFTLQDTSAVCDFEPPVAPAIRLNWSASSDATSYDVYRNGSLYFSNIPATDPRTFYNNANVAEGQTYTYFIRARKSGCASTDSNTISVFVPTTTCPDTPQCPGAFTLQDTSAVCDFEPPVAPAIRLNWSASSDATSYDVYRNGSLYFSNIPATDPRTFYNNANVAEGQTYTYFIRARKSGCASTDSNTISVFVPTTTCP